ncbi:cryptochrome/photolyase family protein [Muricauda ruestringensis]|uniref:Cryptochrome/photolyase family protein n=1 Tax=Flagellimonas aurea TaxID=2915619 RepID=A0ABS3G4T4_9FLAO|nr:cryptochrome/photolyase family protein [Allomuricauda aurea]MAO16356.1 cryptochrome/photolyase family protein [Allomuricauda sp.]MBO0354419.1 cryptochrome/photolyase family protein [Allomuricauda aurea]
MKTLRLILGDQLNLSHSWLDQENDDHMYLMAEMRQETDYVKHHIQKVVGFFLAMRNFADALEKKGHNVVYFKIGDQNNPQNLSDLIEQTISEHKIEKFEYQLPDEYRLDQQLQEICKSISVPSEVFDTEHFYTKRDELKDHFKGKKQLLMESFYRMMRKKHNILMENDQPEGGKWNFDQSNRKKWDGSPNIPKELSFNADVTELLEEIQSAEVKTFGNIDAKNFPWPTSYEECTELLDFFCSKLLTYFGDYQDALHTQEKYLFHSRLSFAMNSKMLSPKEVINTVLEHYYEHKDDIDISQVEGFIRQILGWREYMRGVYWKEMPEYAQMNKLENHNALPDFFWTGKTKMNCLQKAITQSLDDAYAHHIQRLMVIGNYALLTQVDPSEVDAWYLGVYIDAIEWVEITNTRGMSQFADGGIIATKPYVSSANYINKMGNYCKECSYSHTVKSGENSCPFNSLYWNFLEEKKGHFKNNQRMSMMLSLLEKKSKEELNELQERAQKIIEKPDEF